MKEDSKLPAIYGTIDVDRIDERFAYKADGRTFIRFILVHTPASEWDDYMVIQGVSKEDHEKGIRGPKIGNGRLKKSHENQHPPGEAQA